MVRPDARLFLRKRYLVGVLTFFGMACSNILRTNLSIALVRMTLDKRVVVGNETVIQRADFSWSAPEKGFILSISYWGYIFAPLAGYIGSKIGFITTFGLAFTGNAIFTVLSPILLRKNMVIYMMVRVLEGACESTILTTFPCIFLYWSSPKDRCRMMSLSHAGNVFGSSVNYVMCGFIAEHMGWEAVFYIPGGIVLFWSFLWFSLVTNHPADDKLISEAEKEYLMRVIQVPPPAQKLEYPWKQILTSKPAMAVCNEFFSISWIYVFLLSGLPFYIKDIGFENMASIGLLSSVPQVCAFISEPVYGVIADFLRSRPSLGVNRIHKIIIGLSQLGTAIGLIVCSLYLDFTGSIAVLSVTRIFVVLIESSLQVLLVDAFGRFAGFVKGMGLVSLCMSSMLSPILMGFITANHTRSEWNLYLLILSIFNLWSMVFFFFFGSGRLQPWADILNADQTVRDTDKNRFESSEKATKK